MAKKTRELSMLAAPKKIAVVGRHAGAVKKIAAKLGFIPVTSKPELVVTFGGDGTILLSEQQYPGVPKLCARFSTHCIKCGVGTFFHGKLHHYEHVNLLHSKNALEKALRKIASRKEMKVREEKKLLGEVLRKGKRVFSGVALNEVQVHNKNPLHAVRGLVKAGGRAQYFIGDGAVVSTPFGSTAYFYSIARKSFKKGVGIAFNNPTSPTKPIVLPSLQGKSVSIFIERRRSLFITDNSTKTFVLEAGDHVRVTQAKQSAWFVEI